MRCISYSPKSGTPKILRCDFGLAVPHDNDAVRYRGKTVSNGVVESMPLVVRIAGAFWSEGVFSRKLRQDQWGAITNRDCQGHSRNRQSHAVSGV